MLHAPSEAQIRYAEDLGIDDAASYNYAQLSEMIARIVNTSIANKLDIENPGQYKTRELARLIQAEENRREGLKKYRQMLNDARVLGAVVPENVRMPELSGIIYREGSDALKRKKIVEGKYVTYRRFGVCLVEKIHERTSRITLRPIEPGTRAQSHEMWLVALTAEVCDPPGKKTIKS